LGHRDILAQTEYAPAWFNMVGVAAVRKTNSGDTVQAAAQAFADCSISSSWYLDRTSSQVTQSRALTISGRSAYLLVYRVEVQPSVIRGNAIGDFFTVIAIDLGEEQNWGLFFASATINDQRTMSGVAAAQESLRVG